MKNKAHLIDMHLLSEELQRRGVACTLRTGGTMGGLRGMKFFEAGKPQQEDFLLICQNPQMGTLPSRGNMLLLGDWSQVPLSPHGAYLFLPEAPDLAELFNLLTDLFVYFENMEAKLRRCLQQDGGLKKICDLWLELFDTDVFIHDQFFRILACPRHIAGLPPFEYNEQIGYYMQDQETLNLLLSSTAYQQTLSTRGGGAWKNDFNDISFLYSNIWSDGSYQGRMVVLDDRPTPGKLRLVEYFAEAAFDAMQNRSLFRSDGPEPLRSVMLEAIHGEAIDEKELTEKLQWLGWDMQQSYVCAAITFGKEELSRYVVMSISRALQKLLKACYACFYQDAIYLLTNLTVSGLTMTSFRSQISQLVPEAIVHMYVSQEFYDLTQLTDYMTQVRVAGQYIRDHRFPGRYNEFQNFALHYWLSQGTREMQSHSLVSNVLPCLKRYDRNNGTDLYRTLKIFLITERNATLASQRLQIHRSTLPHRLNRIQELTGIDLDSFRNRLYLLMSFSLEELEETPDRPWPDTLS